MSRHRLNSCGSIRDAVHNFGFISKSPTTHYLFDEEVGKEVIYFYYYYYYYLLTYLLTHIKHLRQDRDDNIVMAYNNPGDPGGVEMRIKCASLLKLVERLTMTNNRDLSLRYTFLLTYPSFTTASEFLGYLFERYFAPLPPNATPAELAYFKQVVVAPLQIRVRSKITVGSFIINYFFNYTYLFRLLAFLRTG